MPSYLSIVNERRQISFMIDFHKHRALMKAKTAMIQGVPLEEIPEGPSGFAEGIVLIHRDWKNLYFLIERKTWKEEEYFFLARELIRKKGIVRP